MPCCQIHECFFELLTSGGAAVASWDGSSVDVWLSMVCRKDVMEFALAYENDVLALEWGISNGIMNFARLYGLRFF